jgi:hypothetical protein
VGSLGGTRGTVGHRSVAILLGVDPFGGTRVAVGQQGDAAALGVGPVVGASSSIGKSGKAVSLGIRASQSAELPIPQCEVSIRRSFSAMDRTAAHATVRIGTHALLEVCDDISLVCGEVSGKRNSISSIARLVTFVTLGVSLRRSVIALITDVVAPSAGTSRHTTDGHHPPQPSMSAIALLCRAIRGAPIASPLLRVVTRVTRSPGESDEEGPSLVGIFRSHVRVALAPLADHRDRSGETTSVD